MAQERAGQKWTDDETHHLIKQINESGLDWKDIAENHGRSILSVQMKAVYEYLKDQNQPNEIFITELSDKIKVSNELIKEIVRKKQKRVEKQEKSLEKKEKEKEKEKTKYDSKSFGILWDFKIYLLSKYDFDDDIHGIFDDFVKEKMK